MNKPRHHTLGAILSLQSARPECSVCDWLKWREDSCCSRCISTLLITSGTFYCYGVTFNPVTYPSVNQNAPLQPEFLCGAGWLSHLFLNLSFFFLCFRSETFFFTIGPVFFPRKLIPLLSNFVPLFFFFKWHQDLSLFFSHLSWSLLLLTISQVFLPTLPLSEFHLSAWSFWQKSRI